jgi:hypothetical protein
MPSTSSSSSSKLSKMEKGKDYPDLPRPYPMMPKTIRKAQSHNKNKRPEIEKPSAFKTKFTKKIHNGVEFSKMKIWREGEKTPLSTLSTTSIGPQGFSPTQPHRINSQNSAKSSDTFGQFINIERNNSNSSKSRGIKRRKYTHKKNKKAKNTRRRKNIHKNH